MARLVALDLPGGAAILDVVLRAWDAGDAVAPLPQGLPAPARAELLAALRPHAVVSADDPDAEVDLDPSAPPLDDGDALVVASSGSTGAPKVLVHTVDGLTAHATAVHARLQVDLGADRWLACLPLNHLGGFGVIARALITGTPVDAIAGFDRDAVAEAPRSLGSTLTSLVPTALDRLDAEEAARFRQIVLGGSADPTERPANVVRTYGSTETGGGVVYDGRPLDGVEVRIDPSTGAIAVRTPTLARGRRAPDGTVTRLTDADGWFATGDLGRWADDRLIVEGRADDLIITGGENVWPGPVEAVLATHPGVAEVAVVGRADAEWGQRVVAVVVPVDPAAAPTLDALRSLVADRLPQAHAPRQLELVDALARTSLGKVVRPR